MAKAFHGEPSENAPYKAFVIFSVHNHAPMVGRCLMLPGILIDNQENAGTRRINIGLADA